MTVETLTCHNCGKKGHYTRNCKSKKDSNNNSKPTGAHDKRKNKESSKVKKRSNYTAEQKRCYVHKTTSHDDAECYRQGAPRPPENDNAHIA